MSDTSTNYSDLTIIVPTLNEEESIQVLLEQLDNLVPNSSVIITDDGSEDHTKEIAESFDGNLKIIFLDRRNATTHGLTVSVIDAIQNCTTPYFLVMDGDMQHPPKKIEEFYQLLREGYDLIGGRRKEIIGGWSLYRKSMSFIASFMGKLILHLRKRNKLKDILSGFFASKTDIWINHLKKNRERFELEGYKILFDFLRTYPQPLKINEVKYSFGTRNLGESKISTKVIWIYFKSLFKL